MIHKLVPVLAAVLLAGTVRAEAPPALPSDPSAAHKAAAAQYLAKLDAEPGVQKLPSGLRIRTTHEGSGNSPARTDRVNVHYRGTLIDGTEFDSSYKRGRPATFPLTGVIACWTEGVQLMKPGGTARLYCPAEIAYGERGYGNLIPPGALLIFDIELLGIEGAPAAAPAMR